MKSTNLLSPNKVYRVRVNNSLTDQYGLAAAPASFQFTTGTDADFTAAQALDVGPAYGAIAPANVLAALRANKRIMPLSAVQYSTVGSPQANGAGPVAGAASISADGRTFTMRVKPSPASMSLLDVVDFTGASFSSTVLSLNPGPVEDHDPPAVVAVTPPDNATGIATTAAVSVVFSEAISPALSGDFARLSANGQTVAASKALNGTSLALTPATPLSAGTTYLLELNGAADLAGNTMAPFSLQFTTGSGAAKGFPTLVSTTPASGEQGVDVNTNATASAKAQSHLLLM